VRLASQADRIRQAGGEVIAVSVDSDERQAAMYSRWPTPDVQYVADPGGESYLQPLGLFDPEERGGIALPGLLVIAPDGTEVFGYRGRDFADRIHDDAALDALEALDLDPIADDVEPGGPINPNVEVDQQGAFTPRILVPYFKGNRFGALAVQMRANGEEAKQLAKEHRLMCDSTLDAWSSLT